MLIAFLYLHLGCYCREVTLCNSYDCQVEGRVHREGRPRPEGSSIVASCSPVLRFPQRSISVVAKFSREKDPHHTRELSDDYILVERSTMPG